MDKFTNKDIDAQLLQYIAFKQKEIVRLFEKDIFKVFTLKKVSINAQRFKSRFVNKIKSYLIIQAYNDKDKKLVLT